MRSIARCVLPVFVGPRTAVTPRERSDGGRERGEIKSQPIVTSWRLRTPAGARADARGSSELGGGTSPERSKPESLTPRESGFVHGEISRHWPRAPQYLESGHRHDSAFVREGAGSARPPLRLLFKHDMRRNERPSRIVSSSTRGGAKCRCPMPDHPPEWVRYRKQLAKGRRLVTRARPCAAALQAAQAAARTG